MSLILSVSGITKNYSVDPVLDGASLEVRKGQHVGLIGPNGCGKTTLLKIIAGDMQPDSGDVNFVPGSCVGFLEQRLELDPATTVWELAKGSLRSLVKLTEQADEVANQLAAATGDEHAVLAKRYDALHAELDNRGAWQIDFKIRRVLEGLGFSPEFDQRPIGKLSGGQQNRLMLAQLLLEEPELMLLDEPSNHLDVDATSWLENYLADSTQAFILVSHDRYFLDRVTTRTLELVNGQIDAYPGNYTKYKTLKRDRLAVEQRTWIKQQEEIEKLKDFVRRHHVGQKHAQAEDRRKKLERIELVAKPREIDVPKMRFHEAERTGDIVLRCEGASKGFDNPLFEGLTFQIERGERWGILGANGTGKTTLLRCLLGQLDLDEGSVHCGVGVQIGYFDQHLHCVQSDVAAEEAIRPEDESKVEFRLNEGQRRDMLARFGITGDIALQQVSSLSGGQRNRVALANLATQRANFLILDEPTNHLDLWAREALESALREFKGTVLLVSHDRYFLNAVCDHLLVLEPTGVRMVDGNYDTYRHMTSLQKPAGLQEDSRSNDKPSRERKSEPAKRKRKFPYRKVHELEGEIHEIEETIEALQQRLIDPAVLRNKDAVLEAQGELKSATEKLRQLYEHWEESMELN